MPPSLPAYYFLPTKRDISFNMILSVQLKETNGVGVDFFVSFPQQSITMHEIHEIQFITRILSCARRQAQVQVLLLAVTEVPTVTSQDRATVLPQQLPWAGSRQKLEGPKPEIKTSSSTGRLSGFCHCYASWAKKGDKYEHQCVFIMN